MEISYDSQANALYIKFSNEQIAYTAKVEGGVLIDYGEGKKVIGIELLNASSLTKTKPLREIIIKIQDEEV